MESVAWFLPVAKSKMRGEGKKTKKPNWGGTFKQKEAELDAWGNYPAIHSVFWEQGVATQTFAEGICCVSHGFSQSPRQMPGIEMSCQGRICRNSCRAVVWLPKTDTEDQQGF